MAVPSSATGDAETGPELVRRGRGAGRRLAILLATLLALGLLVWTVGPRPSVHGEITSTIMNGQVALTATGYDTGCIAWTNGTQGGDLHARIPYELVNLRDTEVSVSVIVVQTSHGFEVVAEHPYVLGPYEAIVDVIEADVPYLGTCPAAPLGLGLSSQGSA